MQIYHVNTNITILVVNNILKLVLRYCCNTLQLLK